MKITLSKETVKKLEEIAKKNETTVERLLEEWLSHEFFKLVDEAMDEQDR